MKNYTTEGAVKTLRIRVAAIVLSCVLAGTMAGCIVNNTRNDKNNKKNEASNSISFEDQEKQKIIKNLSSNMFHETEITNEKYTIVEGDYSLKTIVEKLRKLGYDITEDALLRCNVDREGNPIPSRLGNNGTTPQLNANLDFIGHKFLEPKKMKIALMEAYLNYVINISDGSSYAKGNVPDEPFPMRRSIQTRFNNILEKYKPDENGNIDYDGLFDELKDLVLYAYDLINSFFKLLDPNSFIKLLEKYYNIPSDCIFYFIACDNPRTPDGKSY